MTGGIWSFRADARIHNSSGKISQVMAERKVKAKNEFIHTKRGAEDYKQAA